jgi:hypothetical protein
MGRNFTAVGSCVISGALVRTLQIVGGFLRYPEQGHELISRKFINQMEK